MSLTAVRRICPHDRDHVKELSEHSFTEVVMQRRRRNRLSRQSRTQQVQTLETRALLSTITVTSLADNMDVDGQVTLREAIKAANEDVSVDGSVAGNGPDEIRFDPEIIGTIEFDRSLGSMVIREELNLRGNGTDNTVLNPSGRNGLEVLARGTVSIADLAIENASVAITLPRHTPVRASNLSLRNNETGIQGYHPQLTVTGSEFIGNSDRAIDAREGFVTVRDSEFRSNAATSTKMGLRYGGAIYQYHGELVVTGATFVGNTAESGGAIWLQGSPARIEGSYFEANTATGGGSASGGAVGASLWRQSVEVVESTFVRNSAEARTAKGGAVWSLGGLMVTRSTFKQNVAMGGGGIWHEGDLYVADTSLTGNELVESRSWFDGAGIYHAAGDLTVQRSLFSNNKNGQSLRSHARDHLSNSEPESVVIDHTTFSNNGRGPSATAVSVSADSIVMSSSTVFGMGVTLLASQVHIENSVLSGTGQQAPRLRGGDLLRVEHSLISSNEGTDLVPTAPGVPDAHGNFIGSADSPIDPMLGPLLNNGGTTRTHLPQPGSLLIDNGTAMEQQADQRGFGFPRPAGDGVDIGAAETFDLALLVAATNVVEGDSHNQIEVEVSLLTAADEPVTVTYQTTDGTAQAGEDYESAAGELTFSGQGQPQRVSLTILGDTDVELDETFGLQFAVGSQVVAVTGEELTIVNEDRGLGLSGGEILLFGTDQDDVAEVAMQAGQYVATFNGETRSVPVSEIDRIRFDGQAGDNRLSIQSDIGVPAIVSTGPGDDTIQTGAGDDIINSGEGRDLIGSEAGHDHIDAGAGADSIDAGAGDDSVLAGDGDDEVQGQDGDDTLEGGDGLDLLHGGTGNDSLSGQDGDDRAIGGAGDDTLTGGDGSDRLEGNAGNDLIGQRDYHYKSGHVVDSIFGGSGNDRLYSTRTALVAGGSDNDFISATGDDSTIRGGSGNDAIYFEDGTAWGGAGNDSLTVRPSQNGWPPTGAAVAYGDAGDDEFDRQGHCGKCRVWFFGGKGDDHLNGGRGRDILDGGLGDDTLRGGGGRDLLMGGPGDDDLAGGRREDKLIGNGGNDILRGATGDDLLYGGKGNDTLTGGVGDDVAVGGNGSDIVRGGDGRDIVVGGEGSDLVRGEDGEDIVLAGTTTLNSAQLLAVRDEWASSRSQSVREANLRDGSGSDDRLNGDAFVVAGSTVFGDASGDNLFGQEASDWFFANRSLDLFTDYTQTELLDELT